MPTTNIATINNQIYVSLNNPTVNVALTVHSSTLNELVAYTKKETITLQQGNHAYPIIIDSKVSFWKDYAPGILTGLIVGLIVFLLETWFKEQQKKKMKFNKLQEAYSIAYYNLSIIYRLKQVDDERINQDRPLGLAILEIKELMPEHIVLLNDYCKSKYSKQKNLFIKWGEFVQAFIIIKEYALGINESVKETRHNKEISAVQKDEYKELSYFMTRTVRNLFISSGEIFDLTIEAIDSYNVKGFDFEIIIKQTIYQEYKRIKNNRNIKETPPNDKT